MYGCTAYSHSPSPIPLVFIVNSKQAKFLPVYRNFSRIFSSEWAETPVLVLDSLPIQAKTHLHSISGIASTAYGRPQAVFLQIFHEWKSVKIAHKGNIPLTPFTLKTKRILYWKR